MNKIPQSVLRSATRRGSLQGLQRSPKRKAVTFDNTVLVFEDNSFSQEERKDMFYTDADMESFETETRRIAENSRDAFSQQMPSQDAPDSSSSDDVLCIASYAGMEGFLFPERKQKHKLQGILSVLMEQERQYREQGLFTPIDFDSMSHFYHVASQESQEEAHQRALLQRMKLKASLQ